jgi:predicted PurR-regulated permease PerM
MPSSPPFTADRLQAAFWIAFAIACVWLLAALGPVLTPFLLAAILAYVFSPLVDRLQRLGLPRAPGVVIVLLALGGLVAALALILLPLLAQEANLLTRRVPEAVMLANQKLLPWLRQTFGIELQLDPASIKKLLGENMDTVQAVLEKIYLSAKVGGSAVVGFLVMLVLVPVVMFYLLLDWGDLLERIDHLIPRRWQGKVADMAQRVDAVLSEYLRGQVLVMLILAVYYSLALWIAGLPSALSVGVLTGLLIFIPYLGYATGLILALLVATLQFQGMGPIVAVLVVFGIGQVLESFLLTPFLVGNRIGLHPLAVIFALMAFGQLFGFFGVLLALPASAALLVGLRELKDRYVESSLYTKEGEP